MTPTDPTESSLQFIGTATMLLRLGPFTVLTDPNFLHRGQRAYLGYGLTSKRRTDPAVQIDELPPLDAIVLSHMHGDHWDRVAKKNLAKDVPVLTTPKAARALVRQGFRNAHGLATWGEKTLTKGSAALRVVAMPGRHGRGRAQHLLPPVMGSVLEYESRPGQVDLRLYITGDTLLVRDLQGIPMRYPDIDYAVLHLGGTTLPGGLVVTMDGFEGAHLAEMLRPHRAVPVHYDDYGVFKSPLSDFENEMARRGLSELVEVVPRGATHRLARHRAERLQ